MKCFYFRWFAPIRTFHSIPSFSKKELNVLSKKMKANSLLCMIIHFLAINPSQANSNKRTQDGASSSIPTALDDSKSGFPSFYELTKSGTFGISTKVPIYLRYFASDGLPGDNKTYTSSFEVNVDDYSQLVVPSCRNFYPTPFKSLIY